VWTLDVGPMFHDLVHMINYKQMRDENTMHLVMTSAQKKTWFDEFNIINLDAKESKIDILRTSSIY
jgi:hypothetical protein